ncbi:MAG: TadE/TadG family type IV pilus assembly protein [Planctomycetota bacterium]
MHPRVLQFVANRRPSTPRRRGAAVVEFAIVAPVFFLVMLGMIEFGRMAMVQQVITNAAREGARIAVLDNSTKARVTNKVKDYLKSSNITSATINVTPDPPSSAAYDESVTVTVSVPFNDVSWLPAPFFFGGKSLQAESVMRRETVE